MLGHEIPIGLSDDRRPRLVADEGRNFRIEKPGLAGLSDKKAPESM